MDINGIRCLADIQGVPLEVRYRIFQKKKKYFQKYRIYPNSTDLAYILGTNR